MARESAMHALVLAGGFGRRLEPVTRRLFGEAVPKQFCRFGSDRSLLQQTVERTAPLIPSGRVTVVVDRSQAERARAQLAGFHGARLIEQPCDRGTAAGVLLPLLDLFVRAPDATVLLAASDHGVAEEAPFLATVAAARRAVDRDRRAIVLLGVEPDAPAVDYGWIVRAGAADGIETPDLVARFIEKPDPDLARELLRSRRSLWNTMVLVARVRALLRCFARRLPRLACDLLCLVESRGGTSGLARDEYERLEAANFSVDVLGASDGLRVLRMPAAAGWTDLGTERRLSEWLRRRRSLPLHTSIFETG
jgi:mannose-1-phosphate guanylyltransferase